MSLRFRPPGVQPAAPREAREPPGSRMISDVASSTCRERGVPLRALPEPTVWTEYRSRRVPAAPRRRLVEAVTFASTDHHLPGRERWFATADDDSMLPAPNSTAALHEGRLGAALPPASWTMLRLTSA